MELGDGAVKIFLNMQSFNGDKSLVDLLQYMKDFKFLDEHTQEVDSRIIDLNELVSEVKESVEWEDTHMTIFEKGETVGRDKHLIELKEYKNKMVFRIKSVTTLFFYRVLFNISGSFFVSY